MIKILLVDDHLVVRTGIKHVLETDEYLQVIGEAETGEQALHLCQQLQPDIVMMDIKMSGLGGVEATRLITKHYPSIRVIGLSSYASPDIISSIMEAGACGYLLKDIYAQELISSLHRVYRGEKLSEPLIVYQPEIEDLSMVPSIKVNLGLQQKKVLALMSKGLTNPEIAELLGVSLSTARYHVSAILEKLEVSNRSEAVALAVRNNLIDDSSF